ncbi:hypothetical protein PEC311524_40910 [Pectobacterium carotovorum subsp. carotovorum]|nr:hypothetical protein PEC311524_40910 [Pectobacterium carotovorum subsp. carotovorum]
MGTGFITISDAPPGKFCPGPRKQSLPPNRLLSCIFFILSIFLALNPSFRDPGFNPTSFSILSTIDLEIEISFSPIKIFKLTFSICNKGFISSYWGILIPACRANVIPDIVF